MTTRQFEITQGRPAEGLVDLGIGRPSPALLPLEAMHQAATHQLENGDPSILQYGAEWGNGYFREALARFLSMEVGTEVSYEHLIITNGISPSLDLICTLFTTPGDIVIAGEPTYFLALNMFADRGLKVQAVPVDKQGLVVEQLEEELRRGCRPSLVYTVASFQNPAGVTLSPPRRRKLVELAQEYGFLIVADEAYHLLSYGSPPAVPFASYDDQGAVLSLGSFSKVFAPGLRLGWIQAHPRLLTRIAECGVLDSGGGLSPFCSAMVLSALELGSFPEHLRRLREVYGARMNRLSDALGEHLGDKLSFDTPQGGYYIWVQAHEDVDMGELLSIARAHGVSYQPGIKFSSHQALKHCARLSVAWHESDALEEGVRRLSDAFASGT